MMLFIKPSALLFAVILFRSYSNFVVDVDVALEGQKNWRQAGPSWVSNWLEFERLVAWSKNHANRCQHLLFQLADSRARRRHVAARLEPVFCRQIT